MKINVDAEIRNIDGSPLLVQDGSETKPLRIAQVLINALLSGPRQGEAPLTGEQQLARWRLAQRIHRGGELDFVAEEIVLCKREVAAIYTPLVTGQVWEFVDQDSSTNRAKTNE